MAASASTSPSASASATPSASLSQELSSEQVVTLAEAKAHLRVTGTDDDILIDAYIDAAVSYAQKYQNRKYITTGCVDRLDRWPAVIRPRWSNLVAVAGIQYIDSNGVTQTWSSGNYAVDADSEPGRIQPAYGQSYPTLRGDMNGVIVTYTAGYGTTKDDTPEHIRNAILLLVGHWYLHREDTGDGPVASIPFGVKCLLDMDRLIRV